MPVRLYKWWYRRLYFAVVDNPTDEEYDALVELEWQSERKGKDVMDFNGHVATTSHLPFAGVGHTLPHTLHPKPRAQLLFSMPRFPHSVPCAPLPLDLQPTPAQ